MTYNPCCTEECRANEHCKGGEARCVVCGITDTACSMAHENGDVICWNCYEDYLKSRNEEEEND